MIMPNFLIVGAAKSGTTALYAYLKQHPDVYMSAIKEPRFFAFEGETLKFKGPKGHGDRFNRETITDLKSYQALFSSTDGQKAIGEASPAYLSSSDKSSQRIQYYIPDVKLIIILRQPAERAYSAFMHTVRSGFETNLNFEEVLQEETYRTHQGWSAIWQYKALGFYSQQLKYYYSRFSEEQIKIYLYDDLKLDAPALMQDLFRFLEVDETFQPDMSRRANVSGISRSQWLRRFLNKPDPIKDMLKPLIPKSYRQSLVHKVKMKNLIRPEIPSDLYYSLTQAYKEDILAVQDLINRDLSAWLHPV